HVAERLGARIDALVQSRRAHREAAQDSALGKRAARQREKIVLNERSEKRDPPAVAQTAPPIEPHFADAGAVPAPSAAASSSPAVSARAPRERHKAAPAGACESGLPQVGLLDAALQHQETVATETLEMTSRLIEKKLNDFGVVVRVVAAMPGPVVTRYEI